VAILSFLKFKKFYKDNLFPDNVSKQPLRRSHYIKEYSLKFTDSQFLENLRSLRPRSFPVRDIYVLKFNLISSLSLSAYTLPSMYVRKANPRNNVAAVQPVKDTNPNPEVTMVTRM